MQLKLGSANVGHPTVTAPRSERPWTQAPRGVARPLILAIAAFSLFPSVAGATGALPGVLSYWGGTFVVRPAWIDLTPTAGEGLTGRSGTFRHPGPIRWVSWTAFRARGVGVLWVDTCEASCATGPEDRYQAVILASQPHAGHFTLLTVDSSYGQMRLRMVEQPGFGGKFVWLSGPQSGPRSAKRT